MTFKGLYENKPEVSDERIEVLWNRIVKNKLFKGTAYKTV